ncbi:putative metabolite transport protein GIT1 [Termitomyces sp. J132]|nr:putative metabolite transport protein GIT1 [Termitomyces sp. J132]
MSSEPEPEIGSRIKEEVKPLPDTDLLASKEHISGLFTIIAAGFGLVSDGYQSSVMTMINVVFQTLYPVAYTSDVSTRVSNSLLIGAIIGQVFVGLVCDRIGRKAGLVFTTALIVLGTILATAAHGEGVGGEYPAASTSASEAANQASVQTRGPVFLMVTSFVLTLGGFLAVSVFLVVLSAAGTDHLQTVWRVCFGVGIVLPLAVFYFRLRMVHSKLYRDGAIKRRVPYMLVIKRYWWSLIGTCGSWCVTLTLLFIFDFVSAPNGVFSGTIISSVIHDRSIKRTAEWQLLLGSMALPGILAGALLCNKMGRRNTMMLGFSGYLVFGLIIGLSYDKITKIVPLFVVFYGLMQSIAALGPGNMLGLVSAESYATPVRGTCYGLSAAIGKAGAAVGTQAFTPIQVNLGKKWTFIIAAICGISGVLTTFSFVPDMTGVDFSEEDAKFMEFLAENGWNGEVGDEDSKS